MRATPQQKKARTQCFIRCAEAQEFFFPLRNNVLQEQTNQDPWGPLDSFTCFLFLFFDLKRYRQRRLGQMLLSPIRMCVYICMSVCHMYVYTYIRMYDVYIRTYVLRPNSPTHTIYYVLTL